MTDEKIVEDEQCAETAGDVRCCLPLDHHGRHARNVADGGSTPQGWATAMQRRGGGWGTAYNGREGNDEAEARPAPDFRGFAAALREEAAWSAQIHRDDDTGQAVADQRSLERLARQVEAVGAGLGLLEDGGELVEDRYHHMDVGSCRGICNAIIDPAENSKRREPCPECVRISGSRPVFPDDDPVGFVWAKVERLPRCQNPACNEHGQLAAFRLKTVGVSGKECEQDRCAKCTGFVEAFAKRQEFMGYSCERVDAYDVSVDDAEPFDPCEAPAFMFNDDEFQVASQAVAVGIVEELGGGGEVPEGVFVPKPGDPEGPCTSDCDHESCVNARSVAAAPCSICGAVIGYGVYFRTDGANGWNHLFCIEAAGPADELVDAGDDDADAASKDG
jgi:hypothetical protein